MRICNLAEKKMSIGEKVFVFSNAGSREIAKKDLQTIPPEDRIEAMSIYNELRENDGIINLENKPTDNKKITLIEESHQKAKIDAEEKPKTISLEEAGRRWDTLAKDEKEAVLKASIILEDELEKQKIENGIERLPEDLRMVVNMSSREMGSLPEGSQEKILFALDKIHERKKETRLIDHLKKLDVK